MVPPLLASARIGVAPYAEDAPSYFSPLKLFEYLAAGLAVVAADLPGVTDVVGDDAVIVPVGDPVALADAVAGLVADDARQRELGRRGRQRLRRAHTWDHRARTVLTLPGSRPGRRGRGR